MGVFQCFLYTVWRFGIHETLIKQKYDNLSVNNYIDDKIFEKKSGIDKDKVVDLT